MSAWTDNPHKKATWQKPDAYSASMAHPRKYPKVMLLRSSCGHVLGVGLVWKRQSFVAWKRCY